MKIMDFAEKALLFMSVIFLFADVVQANCGDVITVKTHGSSTTKYVLQHGEEQRGEQTASPAVVLLLLVGANGFIDFDSEGCPQNLKGNFLIRSLPLFHKQGFSTALIDAPSDYQGEDGLGGFRIENEHAQDIGIIINELQSRTKSLVWVIGTSRGTLSAANAAARLPQQQLPAGVILTSALMEGANGNKAWVADSVFDLPLENIRLPFLIIGHAEDKCVRTPSGRMQKVLDEVNSSTKQMVMISSGPGFDGPRSVEACKGRTPHGFLEQEEQVVNGITRFIRNGKY